MTDDFARDASRRFRRRVASGHAEARRRYLTPELRAEAEKLKAMIDKAYHRSVNTKVRRRVNRIRQGATVEQSRRRNWRQLILFEEHDDVE